VPGAAVRPGAGRRAAAVRGAEPVPRWAARTAHAPPRRPARLGVVKRLLIVHHTTSPTLQAMYEAVESGAGTDEIEGVQVVSRPALTASAVDVLDADCYLLGTPVNIGYISGALKHFFDQIYYPCLQATAGRPYAAYLHANNDATGALRALEAITTGLRWRRVRPPVVITGEADQQGLRDCWELGATVAAELAG
jgi:NADPH-dependent FMN reductase